MALLDSYFSHLQSRTGADNFVLVRDDAQTVSPKSSTMTRRRTRRSSPCNFKSRPEFGGESKDLKLPSPPLRMESQDDLSTISLKRTLFSQNSPEANSRFKSLFGAEITSSLQAQKDMMQTPRIQLKAMVNLAAPKFPMRKGSCDDLCALKASSLMNRFVGDSTLNKKLQLTQFLDEVTHVLEEESASKRRCNGDECNVIAPFLSPYGSPDIHDTELPARWENRPAPESTLIE